MTDLTLDEMRVALAPALPRHAAFDGWGGGALAAAAAECGIDPGHAALAFPGGAFDMIDAWFAAIDRGMAEDLPPERLAATKIRDRIAALVEARLARLEPHRDALRRALAILASPRNAAAAARLGWRAADAMWRLAGDTATDLNHVTKRATLLGVYGATLLAFLDDESEGHADTSAFLARRIEDIMGIERAKAMLRRDPDGRFSVTRFLGRLRYPAA